MHLKFDIILHRIAVILSVLKHYDRLTLSFVSVLNVSEADDLPSCLLGHQTLFCYQAVAEIDGLIIILSDNNVR